MIKTNYKGFTLLELLIVVIIVAVLAAVAWPQYKHAVLKSRFSKVMPVAKAVADANEVFYLGSNYYANNTEKDMLDVSAAPDTTVELPTQEQEEQYNYVAVSRADAPGLRYIVYQKHSPRFAENIHCEADADSEDTLWLCEKGLHGTEIPGGSINTTQGKTYKTFLLEGNAGDDTFIPPCPAGATCDSDTGAVTGCTDEYYMKDGSCVARSIFSNTNQACLENCQGALFTGMYTVCQMYVANGCTGAIFSGDYSVCDARKRNVCNGAIIQAGGRCEGYKTGACDGVLYGANPGKDPSLIGCCNGNCPNGAPRCKVAGGAVVKDWTNKVFETNGWWGGYCDPASMASGFCPAGSPKKEGDCWDGAGNTVTCS